MTGNHRAPGTLPVESWLLVGKKRQQIMLASLVAAALLLVAVPRPGGMNPVNTAVADVIGVHTGAKKPPAHPSPAPPSAVPHTAPAKRHTSTPTGGATPVKTSAATDRGPAQSMRITGTQAVALTFDDGPDPVETPKILALLAKYQVKATFCLVGQNVQKHPEIVREIVAAGHTLCDHTWNHSLTIGQDSPEKIQADLAKTDAAIRAAVPGAQIPFFRAPGGNFTDRLVSVAKQNGMASLYWEVDPRDWDHPAGETDAAHVDKVLAAIRKSVKPGAIILSHDFNQPDTIEAYARLLPWLTSHYTIGIAGEPVPAPSSPAPLVVTPSPSVSVSESSSPTPTPSDS